jgi:hypothetical protein
MLAQRISGTLPGRETAVLILCDGRAFGNAACQTVLIIPPTKESSGTESENANSAARRYSLQLAGSLRHR